MNSLLTRLLTGLSCILVTSSLLVAAASIPIPTSIPSADDHVSSLMDFTLILGDATADPGDQVCLPLTPLNFTNLVGLQFSINYDAANLTYVEARNQILITPLPDPSALSVANPSPGNLTFTWNDPTTVGASVADGTTLLELCFDITGTRSSSLTFSGTPTRIEVTDASEMNIPFNSESGTVTVNGDDGGGTPSGFTLILPDRTANQGEQICLPMTTANFTDIVGMQFSVNYDATILTFVEARNQILMTPLPDPSTVTVANPSPGNLTFTWNDPTVNGVDLTDGTALLELCFDIVGNTTNSVVFSSMPTRIEVTDVNEDRVTFNGDDAVITLAGGAPPLNLAVGTTSVMQGTQACVPVTATNFTDVQSMMFSVNYNSSILSFANARNFNMSLPGLDAMDITNPSAGNLVVNWSHTSGVNLSAGATLFELCFNTTTNGVSPVTVSGTPTAINIMNSSNESVTTTTTPGGINVGTVFGPDDFVLTLADRSASTGEQICLPLTTTNFDMVVGMQFSMNYDPNALTFVEARNQILMTPLPDPSTISVGNPSPGNLTFRWDDPTLGGVTLPDGTALLELCFTVTGTASTTVVFSSTPTIIEVTGENEEIIDFHGDDALIIIGGGTPPLTFGAGSTSVTVGTQACIPVQVTNFTDVQTFSFSLNYNTSILTFANAQSFNAGVPGLDAADVTNPTAGTIVASWMGSSGVSLTNGSTLFELCFTTNTTGSSPITFNSTPTPIAATDGSAETIPTITSNGTITVTPAIDPDAFLLTLADATAMTGDQICLPLTTTNFTDVVGMQFSMNYDPNSLTFIEARNQLLMTPLPDPSTISVGNPTPGNLTFRWDDPTLGGVTLADGTVLLELCFTVTGTSNTTVTFSGVPTVIEVTGVNEVPIDFNGDDALITIGGGNGPTPLVINAGSTSVMLGTAACVPVTVNNFTDIQNLAFSINYDANILGFTGAQNFNASVTGLDAADITNPSAGNIVVNWSGATGVTLPAGSTLFELCFSTNTAGTSPITISGTPTAINVTNGSAETVPVTPNNGSITVNPVVSGDDFLLTLADATVMTGDRICLPLTTTNFTNLVGLQFSLNYDATALTFVEVRNQLFITPLPDVSVLSVANPNPGDLTFTWNDPTTQGVTLADGSVLLELCFDVVTTSNTTITFSGMPTAIEVTDANEDRVDFNGDDSVITIGGTGPMPLALTVGSSSVTVGTAACVPVTVANFADIQNLTFSVNYDASILEFTGGQNFNASVTGLDAADITNPSAGNIVVSWSGASGVTLADGSTLFELCFNTLMPGTSAVSISGTPTAIDVTNGSAETVPVTPNNGSITVNPVVSGDDFLLTLADANAMMGDRICLPLTTTNFTDLVGLQFSLNYDPTVLTYVEAINQLFITPLPDVSVLSVANPNPGDLTFTWNDPTTEGVTLADGSVLLELCFDVIGSSTTTITFSGMPTVIEVTDSNEDRVDFNGDDAVITIGTVTQPNPLVINVTDATTTVGQGVCVPVNVTEFTDIQNLVFSVNYDAALLDFDMAQNFNVSMPGFGPASITNPSTGNLVISWNNASGVTLPAGARLLELCFNATAAGTANVTVTGTPTAINVMNGMAQMVSVTPNNGIIIINPVIPPDGFLISLDDYAAMDAGESFCLPLRVTNFNDLVGIQFSLNYDATKLTFVEARNPIFITPLPDVSVLSIANPNPGEITATWNDPTTAGVSLPDGTVLVELCFTLDVCMNTQIVFSEMPTIIEITDADENEVEFNGDNSLITCGMAPAGSFAGDFSNEEACDGETVCVDFVAATFTNIESVQMSISYNTTDLTFTQLDNLNTGMPGFGTGSFNTATPGVIVMDWSSGSNSGVDLPANSTLFSLCFNKTSDNNSPITTTDTPMTVEVRDGNDMPVTFAGAATTITCDPVQPISIGEVDIVSLTCSDECIGSVTIQNIVNGSGNYTYMWSVPGVGDNASATDLCASTVMVTVTDNATQQTAMGTYNITSPPALVPEILNIGNVFCAGDNSGQISFDVEGGTPMYTYDWSGDLTDNITVQNQLTAGVYSVTITDANGCTAELNNMEVNELSPPMVVAGLPSNIDPCSNQAGGIDLTVTGGNGGNTYTWTGPGDYSFAGEDPDDIQAAGTYTVVVTDMFNCTMSEDFDVFEDLCISFFNIDVACSGEMNGGIDLTVLGGPEGSENSTFEWRLGNTIIHDGEDLMNVGPGMYTVMVDNGDQSVNGSFTIDENPAINLSGQITVAAGGNDGAIDIMVSGGDGDFTFNWSNGATTEDISGLMPGEYCVVVTDDNGQGCMASMCFTVNSSPLSIMVTPSAITCIDETDGCVRVDIDGGVGPYVLTISPDGPTMATSESANEVCDLAAGEYQVQVTDAQGTSVGSLFTIEIPDPIVINSFDVRNDTQADGETGNISISASGGTGALTYNWTGDLTGSQITGLAAADYTVTIEDENGCQVVETYTVGQLIASIQVTNAGCAGESNGMIEVQVGTNAQPPMFRWSNANGPLVPTGSILGDIPAGTYTVEITDRSGAVLLLDDLDVGNASNFGANAEVVNELDCAESTDGILQVSVVNNTGQSSNFNFEWLDENDNLVGTEAILNGVGAGQYTAVIIDEFNCESTAIDSLVVPTPIVIIGTVTNVGCDDKDDGEITVEVSGGRNEFYNVTWSNELGGNRITNLSEGTYVATATNTLGCTGTATFEVLGSDAMVVMVETEPDSEECNGTARVVVLGGTPPYSYNWTNVPGNPDEAVVTGLCFGEYFVEVTDARGCVAALVAGTVNNERFACLEERVVISPDGDGSNDEFILFCLDGELINNHLEIYNRFGQLVYEVDGYANTWEGTSQNGEDLPAGPYYWVLDYVEPNGEAKQVRGSLTIVRE